MEQYQLGEMEERLADLIWEKEPLTSAELVKACGEAFDWKRTTTYTMLKRLIVRGIFVNEKGVVKACMTKEEFLAAQGEQFLEERFEGSLPKFLAAFPSERSSATRMWRSFGSSLTNTRRSSGWSDGRVL